jgi:hypothetical protein
MRNIRTRLVSFLSQLQFLSIRDLAELINTELPLSNVLSDHVY